MKLHQLAKRRVLLFHTKLSVIKVVLKLKNNKQGERIPGPKKRKDNPRR